MSDDLKARLREHDSSRHSCLATDMMCNVAANRIEQLERDLAEARKDALRYQWLRDAGDLPQILIDNRWYGTQHRACLDLDSAVDAAMAKEKAK